MTQDENSVKRYLTNATSSVTTRVLQITVFVWVNQYLLRRIDPAEYSLFPIVISLMLFAEVFKNLLTGGIGRFIVESDARGDHAGVTRIVSSIFPVLLIAALSFALLGIVAAWQLDRLVNIRPEYLFQGRLMLLLLVLTLCLNVIFAPFIDGAYVKQRFVALNVIDLLSEGLRIVVLLLLLFAVSTRVTWLVVASTCAAVANIGMRYYLTRQLVPAIRYKHGNFCRQTVMKLVRFGGWTSIQGITSLVSTTAPALLLNRFGTALDVAAFYLGRLPDVQIRGLASVAASPAQPALIRIFATKGEEALHDLYYRGGRYHLWIALALVAPLLVFGNEIITLYAGSRYAVAANVMIWLLAMYPLLWASAMFFQVAYAIGKIGAYYICDIVVQTVTLMALVYAVVYRGMGAGGAGMAMAIAVGSLHVLLIWPMGLRLVKGRWSQFVRQTLVPGLLPFCAALAACYLAKSIAGVDSWIAIGLASVAALAIYVSAILLFALDEVDRGLVARFVTRVRTFLPKVKCLRSV